MSSYLLLEDAPDGSPNLTLEKSQYSIGDILKGNCTSPPSVPSANITWYINDKQVAKSAFSESFEFRSKRPVNFTSFADTSLFVNNYSCGYERTTNDDSETLSPNFVHSW
ncbi:hypothetical protein PGB90_005614 [Kerria lacca]